MAILNEKNERTEKVIHLLVTTLCARNCKYCWNKQYELNDIPYVTEEELNKAEIICITGGDPFTFSNPPLMAKFLKLRHPNIKKIYVYTNATELALYLDYKGDLDDIDGVNVSIKSVADLQCFVDDVITNKKIKRLKDNRLYVFNDFVISERGNFELIRREWQKDFVPANDSIFRKI